MEKILAGSIERSEIVPQFEGNRVWIPVSVEYKNTDDLAGDARSFGYPVDEGMVTIIKYDFVAGVLAEDTIAIYEQIKRKPKKPATGTHAIDTADTGIDSSHVWQHGLDLQWAYTRYEEWKKSGLIDKNETKEQWIAELLDNYHEWPESWKEKYHQHKASLNSPSGELSFVLENGPLTLSVDKVGNYFFKTEYHDHGQLTKADNEAAKRYIVEVETYCQQMERHTALNSKLTENLKLLEEIIKSEATNV